MIIRSPRGFTLIEVILIIIIMAIAMPVLVYTISEGSKAGTNFEVSVVMSELAQQRIEDVIADRRANGYGAIGINATPPADLLDPAFADYVRTARVCYADSTTLAETIPCNNGGIDTNYKLVTVTVQKTGLSTAGTVSISTVLGDY